MIPRKKPGRKNKRPIRYEFNLNYYELGRTAKEMAEKYDVSESTIYRWQREFKNEERGGGHRIKVREPA